MATPDEVQEKSTRPKNSERRRRNLSKVIELCGYLWALKYIWLFFMWMAEQNKGRERNCICQAEYEVMEEWNSFL